MPVYTKVGPLAIMGNGALVTITGTYLEYATAPQCKIGDNVMPTTQVGLNTIVCCFIIYLLYSL